MTNDDDLRTALTKLAAPMYYDAAPGAYPVTAVPMSHLLSVLAAHPAPEDDQGGCYICNGSGILDGGDMQDDRRCGCTPDEDKWSHFATEREAVASAIEQAIPAEYVPGFRFRYALDAADAVPRALPAPPVVNVDVIREFIVEEVGFDNGAPMTDQAERLAARLRGATHE